ncbi:hypothetical protein [Oryzihumus sp.]
MSKTGMPRRPSARPFTPARDRVAPGAFLVGLGVFALLVASASIDGPGWFDPGEQCALDSSGGVSSAASGEFAKQVRFFPPRVSCSLGGIVHAYQSEARSWLTGLVLLAALACLGAGTVLLWRRARRMRARTPGGRARWHVPLMAVVGALSTGVWAFVLLLALFTMETAWSWVAAAAACLVLTLPLLIHLDTVTGPPRLWRSTSWWRALLVLGATAVGGTASALAAHAGDGGPALGAASVAMAVGGATGAALASGATWLAARHIRPGQPEELSGS